MVYARMTRGVVLSAKERPFVEAAEMVGCRADAGSCSSTSCPTSSARSRTLAVLEFARIILAEAALSFLGLGIQYPGVSWGLDIARASDHELFGNQWLIIYPGILLSLTVLAANLLSSWLRVAARPAGAREALRCQRRSGRREDRRRACDDGAIDPVDDAPTEPCSRSTTCTSSSSPGAATVHAVRDVSFTIDRGETLGLVGESGSGKSVTAQALLGLIELPGQITGGDVRWKGESLVHRRRARRCARVRGKEIAMIFQDPMTSLNPLFTVGSPDRRGAAAATSACSKRAAHARAVELLDLVGIANPARARQAVPARDVGRHAPAGADRHGAGVRARAARSPTSRRRRSTSRSRPRSSSSIAELQQRLGLVGAADHPRPRRGRRAVRPGRGDVRRQDRRDRARPTTSSPRPGHPYTAGLLRSTPRLDVVIPRLVSIDGAPPDLVAPAHRMPVRARVARSRSTQCLDAMPGLRVHSPSRRSPAGDRSRRRPRTCRSAPSPTVVV